MIDAPLGDRTAWKPQWPELDRLHVPIGEARVVARGRARHRRHLRPQRPLRARRGRRARRARASRPRSSTCARSSRTTGTRSRRRVQKTDRVLFVNEDTESHELRRAPDPPHRRGALLRARTSRRASSPASTSPASASRRSSRRRASRSPRTSRTRCALSRPSRPSAAACCSARALIDSCPDRRLQPARLRSRRWCNAGPRGSCPA